MRQFLVGTSSLSIALSIVARSSAQDSGSDVSADLADATVVSNDAAFSEADAAVFNTLEPMVVIGSQEAVLSRKNGAST